MKGFIVAFLLVTFILGIVFGANAQQTAKSAKEPQGFFPEGKFDGEFVKYYAHDIIRPFYSWDTRIGLNATIYRKNKKEVYFGVDFQAAGARPTGPKTNIAGNAYRLEAGYGYQWRDDTRFAFGIVHLSTHLTNDLSRLIMEETLKMVPIPSIRADDLNVAFAEIDQEFPRLPLKPEVVVRVQPVGFRFRGGHYVYKRPVHLTTEIHLWDGKEKGVVFETRHEWGDTSFDDLAIRYEMFRRRQKDGRLQFFVRWSPGDQLLVGPVLGWHRPGWSTGIKLSFDAK